MKGRKRGERESEGEEGRVKKKCEEEEEVKD